MLLILTISKFLESDTLGGAPESSAEINNETHTW